ncbi:MAG: hypothetical protein VYD87_01390 [Pseudomonadota bacterium]|nr:hypothetical protein [Pseudomonadota bacterium]MEE3101237.1 hypothetical protein [Pseudomonadota bacterium]
MSAFRDIVARWPSRTAFAEAGGFSKAQVDKWCERGRSPGEHDVAIVRAATACGIAVTYEELARIRAGKGATASPEADAA